MTLILRRERTAYMANLRFFLFVQKVQHFSIRERRRLYFGFFHDRHRRGDGSARCYYAASGRGNIFELRN